MSAAPTFGEQLLRLAPSDIHIPERLGLFFPDKAAALGRLMAIHGQRTPITVRKSAKGIEQPWTLVTGMHRLAPCCHARAPDGAAGLNSMSRCCPVRRGSRWPNAECAPHRLARRRRNRSAPVRGAGMTRRARP